MERRYEGIRDVEEKEGKCRGNRVFLPRVGYMARSGVRLWGGSRDPELTNLGAGVARLGGGRHDGTAIVENRKPPHPDSLLVLSSIVHAVTLQLHCPKLEG